MKHFPTGELAKAILPFGREGETVAVFRAYFDDSGTHDGSEVVVWGGVVGTIENFDRFDAAWGEMLNEPIPGKPPLRKFSAGNCRWAEGEFEYYKPAERDVLRRRVREIMKEARLEAIAYAIPIKLYKSIVRGRAGRDYGGPSGIAFAACADLVIQISEGHNNAPIACIFDKGQDKLDPTLRLFVHDAEGRAAAKGVPVSYAFAPVEGTPGLQAADSIATEHYWYALDCLDDPNPTPKPHFLSLMNMNNPVGWTLSEAELRKMRDDYYKMHPIRKWLRRWK